jgi:serine/threonine protein kinase
MINQQIQNYHIISLLGEGGMGNVYLGEHVSIKRKVAIKVLKPELAKNEEIRRRFKNEASLLAHLQHPNIVGLIDYVEHEDGLFLIMEYVDGQGLDDMIRAQHSPISIDRAKILMIQVLQAFSHAHKNGVVHRDVKPSNILVTSDDQIKVLDFGIAKLVGDSQHHLTRTGTQIGTVYYMSPEQVKGKELDHRSDIYSLGVTFYELLSGVCPYRAKTTEYEIYDSIVNEPLLPLTETMGASYEQVWNVIEKATSKAASDRFHDCEAMINTLKNQEKIQPPKQLNKTTFNKPDSARSAGSKPITKVLVGVGLLVIAIAAFFILSNGKDENNEESDVAENVKAIVLTDYLNLRANNSISSTSLAKIPFNSEIELIGEPVGPLTDGDFQIMWQKANWNGTEGWVGVQLDNQKTTGTKEEADEIKLLLGGNYDEDAEYIKMRLWAHHLIRQFVKQKNGLGNYTLNVISKELHRNGYRSIIRYHFNENYSKDDPYDYLVMLHSMNGKNMAVFCQANLDGMGGSISGWCYLPDGASYFSYYKESSIYPGEFEVGEINIHDQYGNVIGYLDDESHTVYYSSVYESYGC